MSQALAIRSTWIPLLVTQVRRRRPRAGKDAAGAAVRAGAALLAATFGSGTRSRDREEALLRAMVAAPISRAAAGPEVDAYVARHAGDARARCFAIEMHARRLDVGSALTAFQADLALLGQPPAEPESALAALCVPAVLETEETTR